METQTASATMIPHPHLLICPNRKHDIGTECGPVSREAGIPSVPAQAMRERTTFFQVAAVIFGFSGTDSGTEQAQLIQ